MTASDEIRRALSEFAYEPESFNLNALVADVIDMAQQEVASCIP
jgi:hypothetical protein